MSNSKSILLILLIFFIGMASGFFIFSSCLFFDLKNKEVISRSQLISWNVATYSTTSGQFIITK